MATVTICTEPRKLTPYEQEVVAAKAALKIATAVITPRQARLALHGAGLLDAVEAELAKPENKAAKITWEYALEIKRDDPLIVTFAEILGLADAQVDALFETAKTL
jgi:hypothetical protein